MLENVAFYLSFITAVYLFVFSYVEGIRIANSQEKIHGGTFIFSCTFAFIFTGLASFLQI